MTKLSFINNNPDNSTFTTRYVSAYIGYGNEKVAPW